MNSNQFLTYLSNYRLSRSEIIQYNTEIQKNNELSRELNEINEEIKEIKENIEKTRKNIASHPAEMKNARENNQDNANIIKKNEEERKNLIEYVVNLNKETIREISEENTTSENENDNNFPKYLERDRIRRSIPTLPSPYYEARKRDGSSQSSYNRYFGPGLRREAPL